MPLYSCLMWHQTVHPRNIRMVQFWNSFACTVSVFYLNWNSFAKFGVYWGAIRCPHFFKLSPTAGQFSIGQKVIVCLGMFHLQKYIVSEIAEACRRNLSTENFDVPLWSCVICVHQLSYARYFLFRCLKCCFIYNWCFLMRYFLFIAFTKVVFHVFCYTQKDSLFIMLPHWI